MEVPAQIITTAKSLIDAYGSALDYLGKYESKDVFLFHFPDDLCAGFPFLYLFKDDQVTEITGTEALNILDRLPVENLDILHIE